MAVLSHMQPRDPESAARTLSTLAGVAGGITVLFAAIAPSRQGATPGSVAVTVATVLAVVAVSMVLRRMDHGSRWLWAAFPFAAIAAIVLLDLVTKDASLSAQIFFVFPALYAGFQLRRWGAAAVGAAAIAGDLIDVFTLLPARDALVQSGYLAAAIVTSMGLLIVSGERQDALVAQLRKQAAIDSLTGLVTRRVLDEAATSALSGAASELGTGLVLIDVDYFKTINDQHGHLAGDSVLVQMASLLMVGTRPSDTVSRMGGDEIAVLLPGCSLETVRHRADQLLWEVRAHAFGLGAERTLSVTVSIGIAHVPTHGMDLRSLYAAADDSLYAAKRAGRNQVGPVPDPVRHAA